MIQGVFSHDTQIQTSVDLKDMDYDRIIALGYPFVPVKRVDVNQEGVDLEQEVESTCVEGGTPLVLEGWHKHPKWDHELFTFPYIDAKYGDEVIICRDLSISEDVPMSMKDYIRKVHPDCLQPIQPDTPNGSRSYDFPLTPASSSPPAAGEEDHANMSADEASTPLAKPDEDSIMEDVQGDATNKTDESADVSKEPHTTADRRRRSSRANAPKQQPLLYAKDVTCPKDWQDFLMDGVLPRFLGYMLENDLNTLNSKLAAENLMIYIGQAGTWTPAHIDQCGAIGHNVMAWADNDSYSLWFMIRAEDKAKAEDLWRSFGHPLEYEGYFASVDQLQKAAFPIYVVKQAIGDFVMVPSLGYHQVINMGKATIKVSWNRLTAHCLKAAVDVVLPRYREIARPEGYRIRTIIKSALEAWTDLLRSQSDSLPLPKERFCQSFKDILQLFRTIVEEEWVDLGVLGVENPKFNKPRRLQNAAPAVCDFCNSDLWNRQFHCLKCSENNDNYDVCIRCFALGRGCMHRATSMEFVEAFSMKSCQRLYSEAIQAWNMSKVLSGCQGYEEIVDEWTNGIVPSKNKDFSLTSVAYLRHESLTMTILSCHRCKSRRKNIINASCSDCPAEFCEKCLYKYYNILWKDVVAKGRWTCLKCTNACHCSTCDKKNNVEHQPNPIPVRDPVLSFTLPEEDQRNRGGVSDNMTRSFAISDESGGETEMEEENDSTKVRKPAPAHRGRIYQSKKRPMSLQELGSVKEVKRKRTPSSTKTSLSRDSSTMSESRSGSRTIRVTRAELENLMGVRDEMALRYAYSNGLWRTVQSIRTKEEDLAADYYRNLFQMDAYFMNKNKDIHNNFRRDILESHSSKKRAASQQMAENNGDVGK
ncbi:hypothetical protein BGZ79_000152 [Entomortierella chlamydospora]|nr:hypothetical protein BGZ79_000152 [Entomortierella chlamydospora]